MGDLTKGGNLPEQPALTILLTGASSGIGLAAAAALARRGHHLVLVGRDPDRLSAAVHAVRHASGNTPDAHRADFASLDEVRALGEKLRQAYPRIDVLANNAGLLSHRRSMTVDGFETTIQVNHLAGFLLSHLLIDNVPPGGRLITTASAAERLGALDPDDLNGTRRPYRRWRAYGSSKQANVLFTAEAARRWLRRDVTVTCFHPGTVTTGFGRGSRLIEMGITLPIFLAPEQGADTLVWLADNPGVGASGGYYRKRKKRRPSPHAREPLLARRLWDRSLRAVGLS